MKKLVFIFLFIILATITSNAQNNIEYDKPGHEVVVSRDENYRESLNEEAGIIRKSGDIKKTKENKLEMSSLERSVLLFLGILLVALLVNDLVKKAKAYRR